MPHGSPTFYSGQQTADEGQSPTPPGYYAPSAPPAGADFLSKVLANVPAELVTDIYASRMKFRNLTFKNTCIFDSRDHAIGYERTNPHSN